MTLRACKHFSFWTIQSLSGMLSGVHFSLSKRLSIAPEYDLRRCAHAALLLKLLRVLPGRYVYSRHVAHTPAVVSLGPQQSLPQHSGQWCGTSDRTAGPVKGSFRRVGSRSHSDRCVCRCTWGLCGKRNVIREWVLSSVEHVVTH
jgi:hypothetical protein